MRAGLPLKAIAAAGMLQQQHIALSLYLFFSLSSHYEHPTCLRLLQH